MRIKNVDVFRDVDSGYVTEIRMTFQPSDADEFDERQMLTFELLMELQHDCKLHSLKYIVDMLQKLDCPYCGEKLETGDGLH